MKMPAIVRVLLLGVAATLFSAFAQAAEQHINFTVSASTGAPWVMTNVDTNYSVTIQIREAGTYNVVNQIEFYTNGEYYTWVGETDDYGTVGAAGSTLYWTFFCPEGEYEAWVFSVGENNILELTANGMDD
jgi:hypothetical protein